MKKMVVTVAMSLVAVVSAAAQSVAGEWDAAMNTPGGQSAMKLVIIQTGETLTGTVKRARGDVPLEGTIKGTAVKFRYVIPYNDGQVAMDVSMTLTGNEMKGTVNMNGQAEEAFSAKRSTAAGAPATPAKPETR